MQCPHKKSCKPAELSVPREAGGPRIARLFVCGLVEEFLRYPHAIEDGFCETRCMANRVEYPTELVPGADDAISKIVENALNIRLKDPRLDSDATNPWRPGSPWHCPREQTIGKLRQCAVSENDIREGLKTAHRRGLPTSEAMRVAKQTGLIDESD